ncbi:MAG: SHOCT domain-containing protein [Thermoleophilia bacterium]
MGWGEFGGFGFMGIFWFLLMAAFWVLIAVGIVLVVKALTGGDRQRTTYPPTAGDGRAAVPPTTGFSAPAPRSDALRILEERYARGDIDRDEFLQRKADLGS